MYIYNILYVYINIYIIYNPNPACCSRTQLITISHKGQQSSIERLISWSENRCLNMQQTYKSLKLSTNSKLKTYCFGIMRMRRSLVSPPHSLQVLCQEGMKGKDKWSKQCWWVWVWACEGRRDARYLLKQLKYLELNSTEDVFVTSSFLVLSTLPPNNAVGLWVYTEEFALFVSTASIPIFLEA
jgi:hypothetical protein